MRMFCFLISVGFVSLLMPRETLAQDMQTSDVSGDMPTTIFPKNIGEDAIPFGGRSVGDCLIGTEISTCEQYLKSLRTKDSDFDYLKELSCPACDAQEYQFGPAEYVVVYICPSGHKHGKPNNLKKANRHYVDAQVGQTGGTVVELDKLECWQGGDCEEGVCRLVIGNQQNGNGKLIETYTCFRNAESLYYYVKNFGDACYPGKLDQGMRDQSEQRPEMQGQESGNQAMPDPMMQDPSYNPGASGP